VYAEGRLRIVNAAPGSGAVDVYILEPGTPIESATSGVFNFGLGGATAHLGYEPGNYTVTFTVAGDKTMVLATAEVAATAGTVQTAILVDAVRVDENSDGKPASVLLIDDLAD
jgi:PKD repeat protein